MTADEKAGPEHPSGDQPCGAMAAPSGVACLARRLSSWTTRLLFSALVLVAGIGFGRQVLLWWREAPPADAPGARPLQQDGGLGDLRQAHEIVFGQGSWTMRRQVVKGPMEKAVASLRAVCREVTEAAAPVADAPEAAERAWLESLARSTPVDHVPSQWWLYQLDESVPIMVGVRHGDPATTNSSAKVAQVGRRVVTWGMAVPTDRGAWTLYTFHLAGHAVGGDAGASELPIPPGSSRILGVREVKGGAVTAFKGQAQPHAWKRFYEEWFHWQGWSTATGWHGSGGSWSVRYRQPLDDGRTAEVDLHFGADGRGGMSGLLMYNPSGAPGDGK